MGEGKERRKEEREEERKRKRQGKEKEVPASDVVNSRLGFAACIV